MGREGFTIVEMLVVMVIAGILLALSSMYFKDMQTRSAVEKQVRIMYTDLMAARSQALYQKTNRFVQVTANGYAIFASSDTTAAPLLRTTFAYPVIFTPTDPANLLFFDSRGVANLQADSLPKAICIEPNNPNLLTSIVISETRIRMGRRTAGGACNDASITY